MLPAAARLRRSEDFRTVTRKGRRAGRRRLVVHALIDDCSAADTNPGTSSPAGPKVGFVVSKAVGNSVVRHRVSRQLRHLIRARLGTLPTHSSLVIRALAPAASASSTELARDLDAAFSRLGLPTQGVHKPDTAADQ